MDAGDSKNNNLVDCAKYMIQGLAQKWNSLTEFTILLVIHLPRVAGGCHSGYPGFPWLSVHIDELRTLQREVPLSVQHLKGRSIHENHRSFASSVQLSYTMLGYWLPFMVVERHLVRSY